MTSALASPSAAAQILRARAQTLARPPQHARAADTLLELLEFRLAQERYAVETRHVREVYPLKDLTPLPCTPPFVLGLVKLSGLLAATTTQNVVGAKHGKRENQS